MWIMREDESLYVNEANVAMVAMDAADCSLTLTGRDRVEILKISFEYTESVYKAYQSIVKAIALCKPLVDIRKME